MEQEVERRGIGDPQKHTLERYLNRWIATLADRREHSPTTLQSYRWLSVIIIRNIGHIALEKVTPADLDQLYTTLLRRGASVASSMPTVASLPAAGAAHGAARASPFNTALEQARRWRMIRGKPGQRRARADATEAAVKSFTPARYSACSTQRSPTAKLTRSSRLCSSPVSAARRYWASPLDAADLDAGTLTVKRVVLEVGHEPILRDLPKSESSERTISIPPPLIELLRAQRTHVLEAALKWGRDYRREPMFLFAQVNGEPLPPMSLTLRVRQVMRRAGIEGRPPTHSWRHTVATVLVGPASTSKPSQTISDTAPPRSPWALRAPESGARSGRRRTSGHPAQT